MANEIYEKVEVTTFSDPEPVFIDGLPIPNYEEVLKRAEAEGWRVETYKYGFCLYDDKNSCIGCSIGRKTLLDWIDVIEPLMKKKQHEK